MKSHLKLWQRIAVTVTAILFGFMLVATVITVENKGAVSTFFGSKTFEVINEKGATNDTQYFKSEYTNLADLIEDGEEAVEQIEAEGATLLKNDGNTLPLKDGHRKVSLFSISSVDPAYGGKGSAQAGDPLPPVTFKAGLEQAGFTVNDTLWNFYGDIVARESAPNATKTYMRSGRTTINDVPWDDLTAAPGVESSFDKFGDAAFFIVSRVGGEGDDMARTGTDSTDGDYLKLSPRELSVLRGLASLKGTKFDKIILLLNTANQIENKSWDIPELKIDAALWTGSVGITGFNAVGDLLAGKITPSGKLSDTFWTEHKFNPVMDYFGGAFYGNYKKYESLFPPSLWDGSSDKGYYSYTVYQEGIYMGYRYAETRYEDTVMKTAKVGDFDYNAQIAYPFGYGKSYTTFEYSGFDFKKSGNKYTVSVDVKNTGDVYSGKEAVQIYVQKPYTEYDKTNGVEKASVELVGYGKSKTLAPDESQTVTVEIDEKRFASYDAETAQTYILDDGSYYLTAAGNAHEAVNNILAKKGYKKSDGMDADGNAAMAAEFKLAFDAKKYAKSEATDKKITNIFDEADINKYSDRGDNKVKYVTRSDWAGTAFQGYAKFDFTQAMVDSLLSQIDTSSVKKDEVAYPVYGQQSGLVLMNMREDADGNRIAFDDPAWNTFLDQLTWEDTATLVATGLRMTAGLQSIVKPETKDHNGPAGLTQPYGESARGLASLRNDPDKAKTPPYYPCSGILTATFDPEMAKLMGKMLGEDALWAGYNGFYGIAINMHRSPYEGRAYEYPSEDPFLAGRQASEEVAALQSYGCNAYVKHFALNDQETTRNGISVWLNEQTLREIYLRPYEMAVVEGGAHNAMISFTRIGINYCTNSHALLTDYLRGELGMDGLTVSDMWRIGYQNAAMPLYLLAGLDIPDGNLPISVYDNFKTGYGEMAQAMRLGAHRILYATVHSNAMNGFDVDTRIKMIMPDWLVAITVVDVVLGALFVLSAAWIAVTVFLAQRRRRA